MSNFTALAMPCNQEQANEMKRLCEKRGIKIGNNWNKDYPLLVNNGAHVQGNVGFAYSDSIVEYNRTLIPYNPAKFLDSLFPEKWCVRDTEGSTIFLRKLCEEKGWDENQYLNDYHYEKGVYYLDSENTIQWIEYEIPTGYTEVTLEELVYHYEQPKEEVMKYRFKTKEEFEATCEKDRSGHYVCGATWFNPNCMGHLFGQAIDVDINLNDLGNTTLRFIDKQANDWWGLTKEMIVPIDYKAPKYNLTITRTQLKEIYDIACSSWKVKIADEYGSRVHLISDSITFTGKEVEEMFKAATFDQKPTLERIFGNPRIAELKARKEELEAELEGINKELNN